MRVDASSLTNLVKSLSDLNTRQAQIANELSSGVRLNHLSDDPVATGQATLTASALRRNDAFVATAASAGNRLQAADTALASVVSQLTGALSTAVGAYDEGAGATVKAVAVQQLKAVRESLLSLANSSYNGSYVFSGDSATQPFEQATDGTVTYTGSQGSSGVALLSGGSVLTAQDGSSIFLAGGTSVFGSLNQLISDLSQPSGSTGSASVLVGSLRDAFNNVLSSRASLNTAQKRLSTESDYVAAQKTDLTVQQGTLLSSDTAQLATELSTLTSQRTALLNTIGLLQKGSLFDYL